MIWPVIYNQEQNCGLEGERGRVWGKMHVCSLDHLEPLILMLGPHSTLILVCIRFFVECLTE